TDVVVDEGATLNLDIALDARDLNPDVRIVMRLFDSDLAQRVEKGFGIQTLYYLERELPHLR
ncbi:MAG: hypothetical protein ACK2UW_23920, partial [Anaerolineales bacterium]